MLNPEIPNTNVLTSESEFNELEPSLKSAKERFQLGVGLNLEIQFYVEPTIFEPRLKFFEFGLWMSYIKI